MKWPSRILLMRHDRSEYNALRDKKKACPVYAKFLRAFKKDPAADHTRELAEQVAGMFALGVGDANTPLEDREGRQAFEAGQSLSEIELKPDVIFVSPYLRAMETLRHLKRGWRELETVKTYEEPRVREQEHGLSLIYNDWRVFHTLHPEQRRLYEIEGPYWYRFPQGESTEDVRDRNRSLLTTFSRDWAGKRLLVITHHLNILATRANLERLSAHEFMHLDKYEKPINCGVTAYKGNPNLGRDGRLELDYYNRKFHS